jgi:hypothetical protein
MVVAKRVLMYMLKTKTLREILMSLRWKLGKFYWKLIEKKGSPYNV